MHSFSWILKEIFDKPIFPTRIIWNKDTFDIATRIAEEMQKKDPDPLIVGVGGMSILKGPSIKLEETIYLLKMRDPATALYLFSKSYEHLELSNGIIKEKYPLSSIEFLKKQIPYFFLLTFFIALYIALHYGCFDSIFYDNGLSFFFAIGFIYSILGLIVLAMLHEYESFKKGREFLDMQKECLIPPQENFNLKTSSDIPPSEKHQTESAQAPTHKKNTFSNNICIRVSL